MISRAVAASQILAVALCEAVTMREPSGLNAADQTISPRPRRTAGFLAARSQTRAVPSADAVTNWVPSGLNAADATAPSCPRKTAIAVPVVASHRRAVLS